jgi:hypothetical protein
MKVRCIDNGCASHELTVGKEYEVLARNADCTGIHYLINNDKNEECSYLANRFEPVEEPKKGEGNMKFKVGDKVRVIDGGETYTSYKNMADKLISKSIGKAFKWEKGFGYEIGPNCKTLNGLIGRLVAIEGDYALVNLIINSDKRSIVFGVDGIELVQEPTEFTFEDLFKLKDNKVYENIHKSDNVKTVRVTENGAIRITYANKNNAGVIISSNCKFKLHVPKRQVPIYKVEHQEDGKQYDFISSQFLNDGMFVVCNTSRGKSYGRIAGIEVKGLTEEEIKQYKECWRA